MRLFDKKNKRGVQLAINFLVTFILAIVIFGAGIALIKTIVESSSTSLDITSAELDERLVALSCSAKDKICVSNNEATVKRGDILSYGVHVNNYLSVPIDFRITISDGTRYLNGEEAPGPNNVLKLRETADLSVSPNSQGEKGFGMDVKKNAKQGQYFYTITVTPITQDTGYPTTTETLIFTVR